MNLIETIEFITASPYSDFWTMLNKNGIFQLTNPHKLNQDCSAGKIYEEYLENYRQIKDHTHLICNYSTTNPLEYIEHVFSNTYSIKDAEDNETEKPYIDMNDSTRKIIFSPAHLFILDTSDDAFQEEIISFILSTSFQQFLNRDVSRDEN